jgi:hypothetical protein
MNAFAASLVALLSALDAKRADAARSEAPDASLPDAALPDAALLDASSAECPPSLPCPVSTLWTAVRNRSRCSRPVCRACFRG